MSEANKKVFDSVGRWLYYVMLPIFMAPIYFGTNLFNGFAEQSPFLIFVFFAAIFNAAMDSIENEHIESTIFRTKNPKFWSKRVSWEFAKKIFQWKYDAWHCFKSSMIICLALAVVTYRPIQTPLIDFAVFGWVWNSYFNVFYNYVFKIKE